MARGELSCEICCTGRIEGHMSWREGEGGRGEGGGRVGWRWYAEIKPTVTTHDVDAE